MTYREMIERRIGSRTATRTEYHALRRHRSRLRRGVPSPDVLLAGPVIVADWARAGRAAAAALRRLGRA